MTTETLKRSARKATVAEYRRHDTDSGSPEVQIALLTQRINHINEHMKINKKDFGAQRGLLKLVGKRNRLLRYIKRTNEEGYRTLIGSLGLRK